MLSAEVSDAPLVHWSGDAYRLIPSRFPPVNVYRGLIANGRLEELVAAENLTNPRLRSHGRIVSMGQGNAEADPRLQNWNLAPFAYGNPDGTLFFGEDRPCLELSAERQTALAVSVAKRESFLQSTQETSIGLDMRMLSTPISGVFWDLRGLAEPAGGLEQAVRKQIGLKAPAAAQGLLFRPAERSAGTCIAILAGEVLGKSTQTVHFRYVWDGARIAVLYAFDRRGTEIEASKLANAEDVLAAA
jgi:hypothetical protein